MRNRNHFKTETSGPSIEAVQAALGAQEPAVQLEPLDTSVATLPEASLPEADYAVKSRLKTDDKKALKVVALVLKKRQGVGGHVLPWSGVKAQS